MTIDIPWAFPAIDDPVALFRTIVFVAALSGLMAGLGHTLIQHVSTVPLILKAEGYEKAASSTPAANVAGPHHAEAWAPADLIERIAYTALVNIVGAIGLALLLVAASEVAGGIAGWRQGVLWGLAGFAAVTLAPSFGLPPELPGTPSADLLARQVWWIAAAALTAAGLALLVFRRSAAAVLFAVALLAAPHLAGAPQPASHETAVPAALARDYIVAAIVSNLLFWILLGALAGFFRTRLTALPT
jgi:cobalt transporter subunit CbtA